MFAFTLWDDARQRHLIARNRLGITSLDVDEVLAASKTYDYEGDFKYGNQLTFDFQQDHYNVNAVIDEIAVYNTVRCSLQAKSNHPFRKDWLAKIFAARSLRSTTPLTS